MPKPKTQLVFLFVVANVFFAIGCTRAGQEHGEPFIVDRTGERWDLDQAVTLGFDPGKFRHGLGRHAFFPLHDGFLRSPDGTEPRGLRVIGVAGDGEASAYSVPLLSAHEIANVRIGGRSVAVGY